MTSPQGLQTCQYLSPPLLPPPLHLRRQPQYSSAGLAGRSSGRRDTRCTVGCGGAATAANGCARCGSPTVRAAYGSAPSQPRRWMQGPTMLLQSPSMVNRPNSTSPIKLTPCLGQARHQRPTSGVLRWWRLRCTGQNPPWRLCHHQKPMCHWLGSKWRRQPRGQRFLWTRRLFSTCPDWWTAWRRDCF